MTPSLIIQYVLAALQVIQASGPAIAEIEQLVSQLKVFQNSGTDPTPAQWAAQSAQLSAALAGLLAAKPGG
jgi:hypothetical protein